MYGVIYGLNILHPFREGNGRTQRLFVELLAQNAGYPIDLSTVSKTTTIQACILGAKGKLTGFEKIIKYALIEHRGSSVILCMVNILNG